MQATPQIFLQLAPFRQGGGIDEAVLHAVHEELPGTLLAELGGREGAVQFSSLHQDLEKAKQHTDFWGELLGGLAGGLPPMKLLLNTMDEPRSWTSPLPAEVEQLMVNFSLTEEQVWRWLGCGSARPDLRSMRRKHGLFASHLLLHVRRGLLPVFSSFKVQGCFSDTLIPAPQNIPRAINDAASHAGCPLSNTTFESKRPVAVWRGRTTGASYHATLPPEEWQQYHRQRLVALSKEHPTHLEAGSVGFIQRAHPKCELMEKHYGRLPPMDQDTMFNGWRFQMVVDGNGAPTRLLPTLCSGALTLLSTVSSEWSYYKLRPFEHYLPVKPDYSDLVAAVEWGRANTQQAQRIAAAASALVNTRLRHEDAECYTYRLLLEYADIHRGKDGDAGSSGNGSRSSGSSSSSSGSSGGETRGGGQGEGSGSGSGSVVGRLLVNRLPPAPEGRGFIW